MDSGSTDQSAVSASVPPAVTTSRRTAASSRSQVSARSAPARAGVAAVVPSWMLTKKPIPPRALVAALHLGRRRGAAQAPSSAAVPHAPLRALREGVLREQRELVAALGGELDDAAAPANAVPVDIRSEAWRPTSSTSARDRCCCSRRCRRTAAESSSGEHGAPAPPTKARHAPTWRRPPKPKFSTTDACVELRYLSSCRCARRMWASRTTVEACCSAAGRFHSSTPSSSSSGRGRCSRPAAGAIGTSPSPRRARRREAGRGVLESEGLGGGGSARRRAGRYARRGVLVGLRLLAVGDGRHESTPRSAVRRTQWTAPSGADLRLCHDRVAWLHANTVATVRPRPRNASDTAHAAARTHAARAAQHQEVAPQAKSRRATGRWCWGAGGGSRVRAHAAHPTRCAAGGASSPRQGCMRAPTESRDAALGSRVCVARSRSARARARPSEDDRGGRARTGEGDERGGARATSGVSTCVCFEASRGSSRSARASSRAALAVDADRRSASARRALEHDRLESGRAYRSALS